MCLTEKSVWASSISVVVIIIIIIIIIILWR